MPINWSTKILPTPVVGRIVGWSPSDHKIVALRSGSPPADNKWLRHQRLAIRLRLRCSRACNGLRREQAFVATKPNVDFDIENDSDELMVGTAITNAGPGPAAIKAVTCYVDRKPVAEADDMGRAYAKLPAAALDYQIMEPGDALAVGERVWLSSASAGSLGRRARVR
jgi:hypothetical protein